MGWKSQALELLKKEFAGRSFYMKDAIKLFNKSKKPYAKGTVYRILHDLAKDGKLVRLGRGLFRIPEKKIVTISESISISDKVTVDLTPGPLKRVRDLLDAKGVEYMITGPSVLMRYHHHIPRRLLHLIYVIKGAGESTMSYLKEAGFRSFLGPARDQLELALDSFTERDLFIIREFAELDGNIAGTASIEKAVIDSYFESTRNYIPFPTEEVGRIIGRVFANERINISNLLWLASRRGIRSEIIWLVRYLRSDIDLEGGNYNEFVESIIRPMKEGER